METLQLYITPLTTDLLCIRAHVEYVNGDPAGPGMQLVFRYLSQPCFWLRFHDKMLEQHGQ